MATAKQDLLDGIMYYIRHNAPFEDFNAMTENIKLSIEEQNDVFEDYLINETDEDVNDAIRNITDEILAREDIYNYIDIASMVKKDPAYTYEFAKKVCNGVYGKFNIDTLFFGAATTISNYLHCYITNVWDAFNLGMDVGKQGQIESLFAPIYWDNGKVMSNYDYDTFDDEEDILSYIPDQAKYIAEEILEFDLAEEFVTGKNGKQASKTAFRTYDEQIALVNSAAQKLDEGDKKFTEFYREFLEKSDSDLAYEWDDSDRSQVASVLRFDLWYDDADTVVRELACELAEYIVKQASKKTAKIVTGLSEEQMDKQYIEMTYVELLNAQQALCDYLMSINDSNKQTAIRDAIDSVYIDKNLLEQSINDILE